MICRNKAIAGLCLAILVLPSSVLSFVPTSKLSSSLATSKAPFSREQLALDVGREQLKNLEWKKPSDGQVDHWLRSYGEVSRIYRRDVFSPADWVRSRRPTRIFENLRTTFSSGLIRQISLEVSVLGALSTFVVVYNNYIGCKYSFLPNLFSLPLVPFNLAAASLGLMLSFRTNVSYQRWNEARTNWGKIINDSRSLARMGCIWGRSYKNADPKLLQRFGEAICSFSRSVMNRTLPSQEDEKSFMLYCYQHLAKTNPKYGDLLANANHRPTAALAEISSIMVEMQLHPLHQVEVEARISELCNSMGACERILTSPVPTFYPRHTTRFLAIWLAFLPTALFDVLKGWNHFIMVPVMIALSGFLLGIEELSNQMEEPFSLLPQEKMCEGSIRGPVMEQVKRSMEWMQSSFYGYNSDDKVSMTTEGSIGEPIRNVPKVSVVNGDDTVETVMIKRSESISEGTMLGEVYPTVDVMSVMADDADQLGSSSSPCMSVLPMQCENSSFDI